MDGYIRREDVIAWFMPYAHVGESIDADVVISDIKGMKAADVAPVRHGHWIMKKTSAGASYTVCSHCNASVKYNDEYGTVVMNLKGANYCPNCGAKMME